MQTLIIDNFGGRLTRLDDGMLNSGLAKYANTFGNDPFSNPSGLSWFESPTRIDPNATVITDLIMAARPRLESGITYVYAVGHTGRLYKIQVNDPTTYNPDYDNPVLLATLTAQTPTFKYGSSIQFYGATEKLFIGHDRGVTKINFDGTGETFVGTQSSYTSRVPRPSVQFSGKLEFVNGTNLVEIDSTELLVSYAKLSPAFPSGTQVRDLDVNPEGTYVQIVVSRVSQPDMTVITQDTSSLSSADSYFLLWNGIDLGVTAYNAFGSYSLNSNTSFGAFTYTMGYDLGGATLYKSGMKEVSLPNSISPNFGAMFSTGNMLGFLAPEQDSSVLKGSLMFYGKYDREYQDGLYRLFRISATTQTDIQQIPVSVIVSNLVYGASSAGYTNNRVGSAKIYFSALETDSGPTTKYRFYKFTTVPTGVNSLIGGVYETQTQLFSNKITIKQVRIYTKPLVANNSFKIDLIDSGGGVIASSSKTFTAGTSPTSVGDDRLLYNPQIANTYALGVRITNLGTKAMTIKKIEIDSTEGGV